LEIKKSKKTYLSPIWENAGWDGVADVWRLEFQFNRPVLNDFKINTTNDLYQSMNSLWAYATGQWLQLKQPTDQDVNKSRWPVYPLWEALSAARFNDEKLEPLLRTRKTRVPSDDYLYRAGLGPITSFMAREDIDDLEQGLDQFAKGARRYFVNTFAQTGKALGAYVNEKTRLKRTRYNKQKPALTRSNEYKRAKRRIK